MDEVNSPKLITCFLPRGRGLPLIKILHEEKGLVTGNVATGRGTGTAGTTRHGTWIEVDVFDVMVSGDRADEIFKFIYEKAKIGEIDNGFMVQSRLSRSTTFSLPEIEEKSSEDQA